MERRLARLVTPSRRSEGRPSSSMSADRVYDQYFFATMADRGFYVFTSPPPHARTTTTSAAPVSSRPSISQSGRSAAESIPEAAPLAEAA